MVVSRGGEEELTGAKLNLGSGPCGVPGWVNVDKSRAPVMDRLPAVKHGLRRLGIISERQAGTVWSPLVRRGNLTKRFPWDDHSASVIYSSHTLEHLTPLEARHFLSECHRVLRRDGLLRLALPDLHSIVHRYVAASERAEAQAADRLMEELYLYPEPTDNPLRRVTLRILHRPHQWMYDSRSLGSRLREVGFPNTREHAYREGSCPDLEVIETRPDSFFLEATRNGSSAA